MLYATPPSRRATAPLGDPLRRKIKKPQPSRGFPQNCNDTVLRFRFCSRGNGRGSWRFLATRALDTRGLAAKFAQVVEPRAAHFTLAHNLNRTNRWRVQRKN